MSHFLRIFNCAVYVPIAPHNALQLGLPKRLSIYIGKASPTIVRHLILDRRSLYCHFDETVFPSLGGDKNKYVQQERQELSWSVPTMSHLDPQLNIQNVVDSMPNAFSDIDKVTRSNIPAANMPARLEIP